MNPDKHTNKEFFIDAGNGHQLYVHDWGDPKGLPVIFLHGGPGAQVKDRHKENFDPRLHRVAFFDQRGCGKSLPTGSLEHNTTQNLIEDITKIADYLKWKRFVICGPSWGSFLALAYAIKNPKRVKALVLNSIFTGSRRELDWIEQGEFRTFFPEVWEKYLARTPKVHHKNPTAYHYKNILGKNNRAINGSALAVAEMEYNIMALDDRPAELDPVTFDPTSTRIFAHYASNNLFVPDRYILGTAAKLKMPVWMVHGRFDIECPPVTAYELDKKLPNSHLLWAISGHRSEHENASLLRAILIQLAEKR
jgi:proline iminopeptidase